MSIDHGKLLALADAPPIPAWLIDADQSRVWAAAWETLYRAITLAQPAEAVEGDAHLKAVAQWFIATLGDLPDDYASLTSEKVQSALAANRHAYDDAMSGSLGSDDAAHGQPAEAHQLDAAFVAANSPSERVSPERADAMIRRMRERQQSAEAVEAKWVTDLRNEAVRGSMKDVYWLSRDQVFELIGDATGRKTPAHPDVIVARATDAAQGAVAPWRAFEAAIDTKALATAQEIALMWGQDRAQFVARIQVAVTDAMRWATGSTNPQAAPAQGDGWKLVPVEPTEAMLKAGWNSPASTRYLVATRSVWSAMLAAAPSQEGES